MSIVLEWKDGSYVIWQNVPYEWSLHMDDDARDHARAREALRGFVNAEAKFLKNYVPGSETANVTSVGRFVGVRDGRHPIGEHVFCLDDARSGRTFRDIVTKPMTKTFFWYGHRKQTFTILFRCLLPKNVDNLILTGAPLSFIYDMIFMVVRDFPWCTQTGEIAGYAAAGCIDKKIKPKGLDWSEPCF